MLVAKTPILKNGSKILEQLQYSVQQEENDLLADGASLTLLFIAEDASALLDLDETGRPLNRLIPFWIQQCTNIKQLLRERALDCIKQFFVTTPRALIINIEKFLETLSNLRNDPSARVRRKVLRSLSSIVEHMPEKIESNLFVSICVFALKATEDEEDEVAREGCDFFEKTLQDQSNKFVPLLRQFLADLILLSLYSFNKFPFDF